MLSMTLSSIISRILHLAHTIIVLIFLVKISSKSIKLHRTVYIHIVIFIYSKICHIEDSVFTKESLTGSFKRNQKHMHHDPNFQP